MRRVSIGAGVLLLVFGVSCASSSPKTGIQSSWTDPSVDTIRFHKAIVVFMSRDPVMRETVEVQLAGQIGPSRAVPSYTIFGDVDAQDVEAVKRKLRDDGFDAAVVMRLVGNEGDVVCLDRFGASAPGEIALRELGFNVDNVLKHARNLL